MVKSPNSDAAISWLKSAATADPRQFYPHLLMADIYSIQGRIDLATNELAGTAQLGVTGSILTKNEFWKYNSYPLEWISRIRHELKTPSGQQWLSRRVDLRPNVDGAQPRGTTDARIRSGNLVSFATN